MLNYDDAFGTNERAEVEGVKVPLGEGAWVKVARLGNPKARRAYLRIPAPIRRQLDEGILPEKETKQFLVKYIANNLLLDFGGIGKKVKGKVTEIKYSVDNAMELLAGRRFRDKIWDLASDEDLFNVEEDEDVKNS